MCRATLQAQDFLPRGQFEPAAPRGWVGIEVTLAPGTNFFRHDAIVTVSSKPDNDELVVLLSQTPADLPAQLLLCVPLTYARAWSLTSRQ